jgi:hypothetical protein
MTDADRIIAYLKLKPHPEGGYFRETYRDAKGHKGRAHSTAIYFLLKRGEISRLHRVDAVEVWHWYAGAPLQLSLKRGRATKKYVLGNDLAKKQDPQIVVPAHVWQSAKSLGAYTLVGCTVAPGFAFSKFELAINERRTASSSRAQSRATTRGRHSRRQD